MATTFSTHHLPFTPQIPTSRKPSSKTLQLKPSTIRIVHQNHTLHCKSKLGFRIAARPSFKSFVNIQESAPETSDKQFSNVKALMEAYKEAFVTGDEKTVSKIEAMIYIMEIEKNELAQKVEALSTDVASGKERSIRWQADFENFRKRIEKDRMSLTSKSQGEVIESLLPIVDNFERAKQLIRPETEKEKKIDTSYQGIYKQFVETMKSLRVAVVETVGKPFDPNVHEAVAREESQEFKEGIVIEEVRRGFLLHGKVLRPAIVKVSAGPSKKKAATIEQSTAVMD